ncbi:MAG: DNA repair protein RecN [bacterium]
MLTEIYIENFALIDRLTVSLGSGLTVLTGETGAGKSIVIDAINVLLGERAGAEFVRTGASRAVLQAVFDLADCPHLLPILAELGVEPEDGQIIINREVAREGRNTARINGRTCPVNVVRQVGDLLVDLHGQHEHQSLLREDNHIDFLDALGDDAFQQLKSEVATLARRRAGCKRELHELRSDARDRTRAIDLLSYQIEEIDKAALTAGEDVELTAERSRLANAEKLHAAAEESYAILYEATDGQSVLDALGTAEMQLATQSRYDADLEPLATSLRSASELIADVCHELAEYRERVHFDPERLAEVDERLNLIHILQRKYGEEIEIILAYRQERAAELHKLTHFEERIDEVQAELNAIDGKLAKVAQELSTARERLATAMASSVQTELEHLGMPKAIFRVDIQRQADADGIVISGEPVAVTAQGIDLVAFHLSANLGEPPRPLAKIASGGELSRIMLALKAVSARDAGVPTLIFDEIDTGIGGRTAEAVGEKLAQVAHGVQVICVTHLAQLAFYGDEHFLIEKSSDGERTNSTMRWLTGEERVAELARLQAGGHISEAVLAHIRTVLSEVQAKKQQLLI